MRNDVEITMTRRGFHVTVQGRTAEFASMDEALGYVRQRLQRAVELRELSDRCE